MSIALSKFRDQVIGKQIEFHSYGATAFNQCTDLVNLYINQVLDTQTKDYTEIIGTNAKDFNTKYDPEDFEWIPNTPDGVPQPGDIIVWNGRVGGGAGHVAVFLEGNVNSFTSLDQNWSQVERVTLETHNYANVSGWLRPKDVKNTVSLDSKIFEDLVRKSTIADKVREKLNVADNETVILAELDKLITYEDAVRQKDKQIGTANEEIRRLEQEIKQLQEEHELLSAENQKLVIKTDEQQSEMEKLSKEAQQRQETINRQGQTISDFQGQLDILKKSAKAPIFSGWKKFLYDLLLQS